MPSLLGSCYAQEHAEQIDDEVKAVLPVDAVDVLAHNQRVLSPLLSIRKALPTLKTIENRSALTLAIAPAHSATGKAMLWQTAPTGLTACLPPAYAPGIDAYGATLVGLLEIAFNNFLGWSHTVNTHDGWDATT